MQEGDVTGTRLRGGDALLAELERSRTGEMLDIVATIQAEQDEIIRAPLAESLAVQGGPGTGKTAVGLHRAAFLIYNHPSLTRDGVLVLGPSRAFIRYIAQVLPSLGEEAVVQTTIADIAPKAKARGHDAMAVRRLKGDARMGELLRRALDGRRRPMDRDVSVGVRFARSTVSAERINAVVDAITARPAPYKSGRHALRSRLVSEVRRTFRDAGKLGADESWFEHELVAGDEFRSMLDHLWPSVSATALVRELLASRSQLATYSKGLLDDDEWPLLVKTKTAGGLATPVWSIDDLPLLDEAAFLTGGRTRSYGHVVIDEAQDLTPMQFRMVARRTPTGSMTILGDLAQATGPWTYDTWDEILEHLPSRVPTIREELTLGYRAPGKVLDFASGLLAVAAPSIKATTSIRAGRSEPRLVVTTTDDLLHAAIAEAQVLAGVHGLIALIAAPDQIPHLAKLSVDHPDIGLLNADGMTRAITIVPAPEAKGLEFDAVVVMEPAAIVGTDADRRRGLRLLYVAMTRPIQHLSIVHAEPLPSPLG
jgi:DNA helicase IV